MGVQEPRLHPGFNNKNNTGVGFTKPPLAHEAPVPTEISSSARATCPPSEATVSRHPTAAPFCDGEASLSNAETEDEAEEYWEADLDDLDRSLWVPPSDRPAVVSVDVQLSEGGDLGLVLKHRQRRRHHSGACRLGFPSSGIQLAAFSVDRNPNVEALATSGDLPVGATLALFNGQIVEDDKHFVELVQIARQERRVRLEHVQVVAPEKAALLRFHVLLGFVLPEAPSP
eukprot:INCI1677.1.p2 GENE.INCI1677.1~~INCI1677.1.p2  ORF type:complete len:229 (-),score=36.43 INCI1677.1:85-771(-)